ncbi:MAG: EsaB/YukD family protein [Lachnospiraceae bacterium]|nr:EsaB/YukD family protein [Lachnospiraceae bacterium]
MKDTFILIFQNRKTKDTFDIEVPKQITANELIVSLNEGLHLGIDLYDAASCFLRAENPIALIKGDTVLEDYKLHDGSIIWYGEGAVLSR